MGFFHGIWTTVIHSDTHNGLSSASLSRVSNIPSRSSNSPSLLDLPVEVRLMIYELSLGDIYSESRFDNDLCYSRRTLARRQGFDIYFNILLVNKQLNSEARALFYQHHLHQLRQRYQTYYVCQTSKSGCLSTQTPSEWTWQLGIHSLRTTNCSSPKALAALRLPMIGLALWHPQHLRPSKTMERQCTEQLAALKIFAEELAAALKEHDIKRSIMIHIDKEARRTPAKAIFYALAPLRASYNVVDIRWTNHGATDMDSWMRTELMRSTGSMWSVIQSDSRREWGQARSVSTRLRLRNIKDEVIKDLRSRDARPMGSLGGW